MVRAFYWLATGLSLPFRAIADMDVPRERFQFWKDIEALEKDDLLLIPFGPTPRPRTEEEADAICMSNAFKLTAENWWYSGTTKWLKDYALLAKSTDVYKEEGLVGSIARTYLKRTNFGCSINTPYGCVVECSEVVRKVPDLYDARSVFFALVSAQHVAEVVGLLHSAITPAQINISEILPLIASAFYWREGTDEQMWSIFFGHIIETLATLFGVFFPMIAGVIDIHGHMNLVLRVMKELHGQIDEIVLETGVKWKDFPRDRIDKERYPELHSAHKNPISRPMLDKKIHASIKETLELAQEGFADIFISQLSLSVNRAFGAGTHFIEKKKADRGGERRFEDRVTLLEMFVRNSCVDARDALAHNSIALFESLEVGEDGSTLFSNLTFAGNFLPSKSKRAAGFKESTMETKVTRGLLLKTLNAAFKSQKIYITCSKDYRLTSTPWQPSEKLSRAPARSCARDNSGPPELKACVDGYCCYLYKWNDRGWKTGWRNEKPSGLDVLDEEPWSVNVHDVIVSSVRAYLENRRERDPSKGFTEAIVAGLSTDASFESLYDTSTPGLFTLPVCFSDYNWATVLEGYRFPMSGIYDLQPHNSIKNLPCNCGAWGKDTEQTWKEIGLWGPDNNKYFKNYASERCGKQIADKIDDSLERFVAYCRLHINTEGLGLSVGKNWQCDMILDLIASLGYPEVHEIDPELYHALACKVAKHPERKSACKGYVDMPLNAILRNLDAARHVKSIESKFVTRTRRLSESLSGAV